VASPSRLLGQTLGHYRILEEIGAGGMGVVYRAHDLRLERDVALKVLPLGALTDEGARKRFRKEALTLSKLSHPNVAMVFDFDTQQDTDFLVTEYIPGITLDARLGPGFLPEKETVRTCSWRKDCRRHMNRFLPALLFSDLVMLRRSLSLKELRRYILLIVTTAIVVGSSYARHDGHAGISDDSRRNFVVWLPSSQTIHSRSG
jgi:serine/threonine protein kinase